MKKLVVENNFIINLIIIVSFIVHLASINFFPTNFEGGYGAYANFFHSDNKLIYLKSYYFAQFNTYLFSLIASFFNFLIPFLDGYQIVKILSASSYFFLGFGILNLLKFFKYKYNKIIFLILVLFNPIIWTYGYRAFNDLFAFSCAIYFFSRILLFYNSKPINLEGFFLGLAITLKIYNLIFLPIIYLIFFSFNKFKKFLDYKIIILFSFILLPFIIYNFFTYYFVDVLIAPKNQDLAIAVFGGDSSRGVFYTLNNFIFYVGYLNLISLPFSAIFFYKTLVEKKINIFIKLVFFLLISIYMQKFFFIASELNLGPLQKYVPADFYKSIILFLFFTYFYSIFQFYKINFPSKKKLKIFLTLLSFILIYLFILSFIKASQRYLILPLPFYFLLLCSVNQSRKIFYSILPIYFVLNSFLLLNYYVTGKSAEQIYKYLLNHNMLSSTLPGSATPHLYHLYNNTPFKDSIASYICETCPSISLKDKINVESSKYIVSDKVDNSLFTSEIKIFNLKFNKFSIIKHK